MYAHIFTLNFLIDLDEMQYAAITYYFVEAHGKFISHNQHAKDRSLL